MAVNNKIIIWGNDNSNLLGVLRQLSENGLNCFVLFNQRTARMAIKSHYCKDYYIANDLNDGISFLLSHFQEEQYKPIILCTGDAFAEKLDEYKEKLITRYYLPGTKEQGVLKNYLNKYNQVKLAEKNGLHAPKSILVRNIADIDFNSISYPCIVKPNQRINGVHYKFKIKICRNEGELKEALATSDKEAVYILQEYISDYQLAVIDGCRLSDGTTLLSGVLMCEKGGELSDSSFGYLSEKAPTSIDMVKVKAYLESINYCGPFGFDFGLKEGKAYFFESNLRIDATNYLFYKMGFNFLYLWIAEVTGNEWHNISCKVKGKKYFIDDIGELSMVTAGKMRKEDWKADMKRAEIYKFKNSKDNMPYIWQRIVYAIIPFHKVIKNMIHIK